jgi:hypothetical protein
VSFGGLKIEDPEFHMLTDCASGLRSQEKVRGEENGGPPLKVRGAGGVMKEEIIWFRLCRVMRGLQLPSRPPPKRRRRFHAQYLCEVSYKLIDDKNFPLIFTGNHRNLDHFLPTAW